MNPWIDVAGWTLVHFLWQGAAIGASAFVLLWALRDRSPQTRYAVSCAALVAMLAAPLITASVLSRSVVVIAPAETQPTAGEPVITAPAPDVASQAMNALVARTDSSVDIMPGGTNAWLPLVVMLWTFGVAVLWLRLLGGWWRISRVQRMARRAPSSVWTDAAVRIAAMLGLTRRVRVVDSSLVETPTVIGWIRPVILLPVAAIAGLSPAQVDAILAHELAHIRRHDFLVNLLQTFAETMLFYHPAVWWLSSRIRAEREHCCDETAVSVCGDAVSYAEALVEIASRRIAHSLAPSDVHGRLAIAATGGTLTERIRRLLGMPIDDRPRSFGPMMIAGVAALVIGVAGASRYVVAAQPDAKPKAGTAHDPAAWSMTFSHGDSTMRFVGFRGRDLIRFAYQVPEARVVGGSRWLDEQMLQIVVNLEAAPRADEMPDVVRQALEAQLKLKTHIEKRNFPVLALVMAREDREFGPKLRVASRPCFDAQQWIAAGQPVDRLPERQGIPACGNELDSPLGRTQYESITMPEFAERLRDYVKGWTPRPRTPPPARLGPTLIALKAPDVIDRTGLKGRYDLDLQAFYPTTALMSRFPFLKNVFEPMGFGSISTALEDQLGLTLVESEAPYDVIVIDQAERP
jgi:uncharacterized protein (TIGR03435 family)